MSLTEKMSAQEKIAQLEARIVYLEEQVEKIRNMKITFVARPGEDDGVFGTHWDRMWEQFDLVMKRAFGK